MRPDELRDWQRDDVTIPIIPIHPPISLFGITGPTARSTA